MYLSIKTKQTLEKAIGKSIADISKISTEDEIKFIRNKVGVIPHFSKVVDKRMQGRGNPLLSRRKICTIEEVDKWIEELK